MEGREEENVRWRVEAGKKKKKKWRRGWEVNNRGYTGKDERRGRAKK